MEVWHHDAFGRSEIYGYGFCHVPTSPGMHKVEVVTWRPVGTVFQQAQSELGSLLFYSDHSFPSSASLHTCACPTVPRSSTVLAIAIIYSARAHVAVMATLRICSRLVVAHCAARCTWRDTMSCCCLSFFPAVALTHPGAFLAVTLFGGTQPILWVAGCSSALRSSCTLVWTARGCRPRLWEPLFLISVSSHTISRTTAWRHDGVTSLPAVTPSFQWCSCYCVCVLRVCICSTASASTDQVFFFSFFLICQCI